MFIVIYYICTYNNHVVYAFLNCLHIIIESSNTFIGKMAENSSEYSTLIDLTVDLRLAVRPHLVALSGDLLASRLISPDGEADLRNTVLSETERSAKLIELVQNKVKQNSKHYHTFTGILKGTANHFVYDDILQKLEMAYRSYQQNGKVFFTECL